jgi:hypothetical protein
VAPSRQPISAAIEAAIAASFAPADRDSARNLIATYPYSGGDRDRVHHALLALADGDLVSLADVAKLTDYRDVLTCAEYTGTGKLTSEAARASLFAFGNFERVPKGLR